MPLSDDWISSHFDHLSPDLAPELHETLARARETCPVARSDAYEDGFWVLTRYADILAAAQDWQTWSSELGMAVPWEPAPVKILPVAVDPPLQKEFKRLVNVYFTKSKVEPWAEATRALVNQLMDSFIERGECDFMKEFARPFPGRAFFDLALHAPREDLDQVNDWAMAASMSKSEEQQDGLMKLAGWIYQLIETRKAQGPRGDVVDAVMNAEIEGRPIEIAEAIGTIHLLILGGLDTTAGVLAAAMLRFCEHPEILDSIRDHPERIPDTVEELLRLDASFVCIGRTARHDTQLRGRPVKAGERAILYWASANRDEAVFDRPDEFDPAREHNRHLTFGAGPHKCVGSNLARMNLRIALEEIARRLHDVKLQPGAEIGWHLSFNRVPASVPITFTPGSRQA